jgi:site-specific recombinase XerD
VRSAPPAPARRRRTFPSRPFRERFAEPFSPPTVKQHLAAIRTLFDWLVIGQVIDANPAHAVRGPRYVVKKGKTPVLNAEEVRALLDCIDISTLTGLRDRALIGTMAYTFARVNAVISMKVKDYFTQGRRRWIRLHEKGGKEHEVPCHHVLEKYHDEYLAAANIVASVCGSRTGYQVQPADESDTIFNTGGILRSLDDPPNAKEMY